MTPLKLTTFITAVANAISANLSDDDLNLTAAAFTQIGDTLATISLQRAICNTKNADGRENSAHEAATSNPQ